MKNFRLVHVMPILLAIVLVVAQSFTTTNKMQKRTAGEKWFKFSQGSTHTGENDPANYTMIANQDDPEGESCEGSEYVCLILAPEGANSQPDLNINGDVYSDPRVLSIVPKD